MLNGKQNQKLLQKLNKCLEVFEPYVFEKQVSLPYRVWQTEEHWYRIPPDDGRFAAPGADWGGPWTTCWFRAEYTPAPELAGQPLYLMPEVGGYEGMLWVDGRPQGTYATKIVVTRHGNHYCDRMCAAAEPGRAISLALEFYAGHYVQGCQPFETREDTGFRHPCGPLWVCTKNQLVADFLYDLRVLLQLAEMLGEDSFRTGQILNALTEAHKVLYYDPAHTPRQVWLDSLCAARAALRPALEAKNGDGAPEAVLLGHSHMDTAWLWPVSETVRKNARTLSNQLSLMDQFPEYRFFMSSACHYKMLEEHYPDLFARMKERIAEGRLEANGAVWVECDCNLVGGEALIRQFLWGQRYTLEKFGTLSDCFWLPDTFGYSAAIPQIMQGFGVRYFLTTKLAWNDTNQFPYETFRWVGLDGTEVLTHFFVMDTWPDPRGLLERVNGVGYKDCLHNKQQVPKRLIGFGYGDGGGGPQFEMIETARRLADLNGCPRVRYDSASRFMRELEADRDRLPAYRGELYLELHRGTLTGKQQIKKNNRMAETALHNIELLEVLDAVRSARPADGGACRPLWETLLRNQFHDILPGSCIPEAHDVSLRETGALLEQADALLKGLLRPERASGVFNPLGFVRSDVFYLPADRLLSLPGAATQLVTLRDGSVQLAVDGVTQQPFAHTALEWQPGRELPSAFAADGNVLETPFYRAEFTENGAIASLLDKRTGRELCAGRPLNTFLTAEDVPAGWDGWDIDADCLLKLAPDGVLTDRTVAADGAVEYRLRCRWTVCSASVIEQDIIFYANSPLVVFDTRLHWNDPHRLLKTCFDTTVQSPFARQEIQFGHIQRPTTRNTPVEQAKFEVCNHKYTDLSEPAYGVALLNDGKYGVGVEDGTLTLTLAKGGTRPDDRGDVGVYRFRYALLPHTGGYSAAACVLPAYCFNDPPLLSGLAGTGPLVRVEAANIIPETVKPCEDGGSAFILRLYESEGSRTRTALHLRDTAWRAELCDMMERPQALCPSVLEFRPFEIKTIRVTYAEEEV